MSFDYNYKFWVATQKDLNDLLKRQDVFKELQPTDDPATQHLLYAELYARYVNLVNKLGYLYHYTFQVQKRPIIKNLVEAATRRLLVLKDELKNLEFCEFIYIDKTLIERRLTPDDIIVWTPEYFPYWRPINIQELIHGPRKKIEEDPPILTHIHKKGKHKAAGGKAAGDQAAGDYAAGDKPTDEHAVEDGGAAGTEMAVKSGSTTDMTKRQSIAKAQASRAEIRIPLIFRKGFVNEEEVAMNPEKRGLKKAVTLIQTHERARVARSLYKLIQLDPDHCRPKARDDAARLVYVFTHKPGQRMLIPIKRTRFEANYYVQRTELQTFHYYVKPMFIENATFGGDLSDLEDSDLSENEEGEEMSELEEEKSEGSEMSEYETESLTGLELEELVKKTLNEAATKIQTYWRGCRERKNYKGMLVQKQQILGMNDDFRPTRLKVKRMFDERMRQSMKNRLRKNRHDEELKKFCEDDRARILRVRGPWIMEDISDGIRAWFKEFYDKAEAFHPYPDEAKGGTLLLLKGETMDVYEFAQQKDKKPLTKEEKRNLKKKEKEKKKNEREKLKKIQKDKAKRRAQLKKYGIVDFRDQMSISKPVLAIENTVAKYKKEWAYINEKLNVNEDIIKEWITSDHYAEIHQELQTTVDEMMRLEYELLQRALAKDQKKKYKPEKKKKKKEKKNKKKKKKGPRDPTRHRSVESLYYELQDNKIAKLFPQTAFQDYIGDRNQCAYECLNILMKYTPPCPGEIKDVLQEYVLGMGEFEIKKPSGILLAGPPHCGKKMLCHIVASEIDAVVLDISPENIIAYHENMKLFSQLIVKMAKLLQPTIIYIQNIHRVYWKKVPPEEEDYKPKILQDWLKKFILNPLKKEDRVFLLATTDSPWSASGKMKSLFQKILLVPKTEYATSFILRRTMTLRNYGVPRDFIFTPLALVTRDYRTGDIVQNINETLNLKRRTVLSERPLQQMEFLDNMLDKDPPNLPPEPKEWEKFAKWFKKVSKMEKKRIKMMKKREEQLAKEKEKEKKKK